MRILLAIVAFLLAAPLLGYGGFVCYLLYSNYGTGQWDVVGSDKIRFAFAVAAGALIIGGAFLTAGISMLSSKSRRE